MVNDPEKQHTKEIIRNNPNLIKIIEKLTNNKHLDIELRNKISNFIDFDFSSDSGYDSHDEVSNIGEI
ncbi:hypothetical protein [Rickettsia hoogstraalii]|uniref:hypothetical protein n=1 Tax=Rickettsia hoogstraalii TaxID=467174 RepID=UPI0005908309|nr:hypothetical protein [Rickettsia hoogstraalii]